MSYTDEMDLETEIEAPPAEPIKTDLLRVADRCDTCGSQAFVQVTFGFSPDSPLLFCNHHFERAEESGKIKPERDHVLNESWKINTKPSSSSPD